MDDESTNKPEYGCYAKAFFLEELDAIFQLALMMPVIESNLYINLVAHSNTVVFHRSLLILFILET